MADFQVVGKLVIDDKGQLKVVGDQAKKASKKIDDVGKSSATADRRLKGAAQASSNTTKNFSKMSQGISNGLVPAYATLAASLFAIGAVFRSLQNAADFATMQKAQMAYASSTGVALTNVSRKLQEATGYQLDLQKASSSAAIMIAKGFTTGQIEQVAKASVAASQALGRNFEDTFNRIVQGTTKAEPELLDELGITLRLKKATEDYGRSVNKNADELTTYERSQAVLNETLRQAAENFGAVGGSVPVNAFNRLGTTFSDLIMNFQVGMAPIAEFFANVLSTNLVAAVAALGLFAGSILKNVLPSVDSMKTKLGDWAANHTASVDKAKAELKAYGEQQKQLSQNIGEVKATGARGVKSTAKKLAKGSDSPVLQRAAAGTMAGADVSNLNKALKSAEASYQKHGKIVSGIFKDKDINVVRSLQASFTQMNATTSGFVHKTRVALQKTKLAFKVVGQQIKAGWAGMMAGMGTATATFVGFVNKVMSKAGFIGLIVMAAGMIMELVRNIDKVVKGSLDMVAGFLDLVAKGLSYIPGMKGIADAVGESADSVRAFGERIAGGESALGKFGQGMRDGKAAADEFNQGLADQVKVLKEVQGIVAGAEQKDLEGLKGAQFQANLLSTSGLIQEVARVQAIQDPEKQKEYAVGVQAIFDEVAKLVPGLSSLGDVLTLDQDALANFSIKTMSAGQVLNNLANSLEAVMQRRSEFGNQFRSGFFGQEEQSIKNMVKDIANFDPDMKLKEGEIGKLEQILGIKIEGGDIKSVRAAADTVLNELNRIITSEQDRAIAKVGTKTDAAELQYRTDAAARFAKEQIKITELKEGEADIAAKIAEQEYAMKTMSGDNLINAQKKLELLKAEGKLARANTDAYIEQTSIAFKLQQTFSQGIEKMFTDIASGAASAKDAFKSLATLILQELIKIAAMKAAASVTGFLGFAEGGIMPVKGMASGGYMSVGRMSYGTGGIATKPTYMVGEGKYNEAVVPLPDGRRIPVEMQGGGAGTNNVTINVDASGNGSSTMDGERGKALGVAIQAAVMETIQREKRPGGVLNRN